MVFTCNIIRGKISLKWTKCTFVLLDGHATLMNNLLFWWLGIFLNHSVASVWCYMYMAPFLQDKYADTNLPICIATKLTCTKKRYQIRIHVPIKKKNSLKAALVRLSTLFLRHATYSYWHARYTCASKQMAPLANLFCASFVAFAERFLRKSIVNGCE